MNKVRRKRVQDAITKIEEAKAILEDAQNEEQAAFDNMPEGLQYGERGEQMEENISKLEEAVSCLEDLVSELEEI